jgi:hypothetical protein
MSEAMREPGEINELKLRVERLEALFRIGPAPAVTDGRPHIERVLEILRENPAEWLTSSEIAKRAGIDPGAARLVLYANKELFASVRVSAGRVKWQISPLQRFACAAAEPALALG